MADVKQNPSNNPLGDTQTTLMKSFTTIFESAQETAAVIGQAEQHSQQLDFQLEESLGNLAGQTNRSIERSTDIFENLQEIESLPGVVARIVGIFDEDFDRDAQILALEQEKFTTDAIGRQNTQVKGSYSRQQKRIADTVKTAKDIHELRTSAFDDQVQLQSLAQDERRTDISEANLNLSGARFQLDQIKDSRAKVKFEQLQADRRAEIALGNLARPELQRILEGGKPPEGVELSQVQDRVNNLKTIELSLQTAALGLREGNFDLALKGKEEAFNAMSPTDLQGIAVEAAASDNGEVIINTAVGPVSVTEQEAEAALMQATQRQREQARARDEIQLEVATAQATAQELQLKTFAGAGIVSEDGTSGTNMQSALAEYPIQYQATYTKIQAKITAAANLGNFQIVEELQAEQRTMLDKHITEVIASSPKETQSAKTDYFNNARLTDSAAAASYLTANSGNTQALNNDRTYGPIWSEYMTALNEEAQTTRQNIEKQGSGIAIFGSDAKSDQAIVAAAANVARPDAEATMLMEVASKSIARLMDQPRKLAGPEGKFVPQMSDLFRNLVNPMTFRFNEKITQGVGDAAVFNLGALRQELAARTVAARNRGLLEPDQTLNDILLQTIREVTPEVLAAHNGNGINKAAMNFILFGNSGRGITSQALLIADPGLVEADMQALIKNDQETEVLTSELDQIEEAIVDSAAKEGNKPALFPDLEHKLTLNRRKEIAQGRLDSRTVNGTQDTSVKNILDFLNEQ